MKNLLIDFAEGIIFGILLAVVMRLIGIESTNYQLAIIAGFAIFAVSILNAIGMHFKGQGVAKVGETAVDVFAVNRTWTYQYGENTIEIKNTAKLCELIVNGQVQDSIKGAVAFKMRLSGKLPSGEEIKASLAQLTMKWTVLVGDKELKETPAQ